LNRAIKREDYEDAARLKVAIAATATNDAVGKVMSTFYVITRVVIIVSNNTVWDTYF